jgi:hypothetical protein
MEFFMWPQKKNMQDMRSQHLGGQLLGVFRLISLFMQKFDKKIVVAPYC